MWINIPFLSQYIFLFLTNTTCIDLTSERSFTMETKTFDYIALTLVIIGALNWGLIGFFQFDLVATLFGGMSGWISRVIYGLVGIAGIYSLTLFGRISANN